MNQLAVKDESLPPAMVAEIRSIIAGVQEIVESCPQVVPTVTHYFAKSVYGREMLLKKGDMCVGKIHRFENFNIISKGEVSIFSIDGVVRVKAPYSFVASPSAKRVIYAHEDTVWTTVHGTDETDLKKIEEAFIAKDYESL